MPPKTIITRWGSWLKAAKYYSNNLHKIRNIVLEFEDDGQIVKNANKQF